MLRECIASLRDQGVAETLVVDNGSADGSAAAAAAEFPDLKLLTPGRNLGFAGGANLGARRAREGLLLFLNPDIRLAPGSVPAMAARFADPRVGVLAPPLWVEATGNVEYGATVDVIGSPVGLTTSAPPLYVHGCALMTRSTLFHELAGFDERFFMFVEDVDYCWRVLLTGRDVAVALVQPAWHFGGAVAAGGYIKHEELSSTLFRVALRERNTFAMLLKCYGGLLASMIAPAYIAQSLLTAAALAARGNKRTARAIVAGVRWNSRELRRTLELRRDAQARRTVSDAAVLRRMYRGVWKLHLLRQFGLPTVTESGPVPDYSDVPMT